MTGEFVTVMCACHHMGKALYMGKHVAICTDNSISGDVHLIIYNTDTKIVNCTGLCSILNAKQISEYYEHFYYYTFPDNRYRLIVLSLKIIFTLNCHKSIGLIFI